jgi:hypothetical protein
MQFREEYFMKKITLFAAAEIILFCIVPIATTRAMPRQVQVNGNVVSDHLNEIMSVFNQKKLRDIGIALKNPVLKHNILTYDIQEFREPMMAKSDTSKDVYAQNNNNPYVKRRGHGRSTMGDKIATDNNSDVADDDGEDDENEDLEDGSSIKSNKGLENTSGYNKDL